MTFERVLSYVHHCIVVFQMLLHSPWSVHAWRCMGVANVARKQAQIPAMQLACVKTRLPTQHYKEKTQLSPNSFPRERVGLGKGKAWV